MNSKAYLVYVTHGEYDAYTSINVCVCPNVDAAKLYVKKFTDLGEKYDKMIAEVEKAMAHWDVDNPRPTPTNNKKSWEAYDGHGDWLHKRNSKQIEVKASIIQFTDEEQELIATFDSSDNFTHSDREYNWCEIIMVGQ